MMNDRRKMSHELDEIQTQLKELEVRYEHYFAGLERREPLSERTDMARRLRQFTNRQIVWTDLKFRYQSLASRFMSYGQYWDRILRLMDEGKYHRHTAKLGQSSAIKSKPAPSSDREAEQLHQQLSQARKNQGLSGDAPSTEKVASFLAAQKEKIRQRFGNSPVTFSVDTSGDKPRIKVSLKS